MHLDLQGIASAESSVEEHPGPSRPLVPRRQQRWRCPMGQLGDSMESEAVDTDGRAGTGTGGFRTVAFHAERG